MVKLETSNRLAVRVKDDGMHPNLQEGDVLLVERDTGRTCSVEVLGEVTTLMSREVN